MTQEIIDKANELMIGDWVLHDKEPYQIRQLGIYGVDRDGEDYPAVCIGKPKGVGLIVERNEIEPIPLTPEILEKNGWVEDGYFYRHKELGYIQLGKLFEHASFDFTKYGINYRIQTSPRCMKYIHQFQHALRLCGIKKEIVL